MSSDIGAMKLQRIKVLPSSPREYLEPIRARCSRLRESPVRLLSMVTGFSPVVAT
jgi:hypothetical protein